MDPAITHPVAAFQLDGAITTKVQLKEPAEFIELCLAGKPPVAMITKVEASDISQGLLVSGEDFRFLMMFPL